MARLRLFANLRELAGTSEDDMPGQSVDEILSNATDRYGERFGQALETAQVWVDGARVDRHSAVPDGAEVAVIPPVSGGRYEDEWPTGEHEYSYPGARLRDSRTAVRSPVLLEIGLAAALAASLLVTNAISLQWFTVAVVLVSAMWAYDITASTVRLGVPVSHAPALFAVLGAVLGTYRFGAPGTAVAVVGATFLVMVWGLMNPYYRSIQSISAGVAIATTAAFGSSAMVLLRLRTEEEAFAFLFVCAVAVLVSWTTDRTDMPVLDPLVAMIVATLTAGAVAGAIWAPNLLDTVAASVAAALALVAGRNLGTLLRAGGFFAAGPIPGSLHYLDGILMASGPFWVLLTVLS